MPQKTNVPEALLESDMAAKRAAQMTAQMLRFSGPKTVLRQSGKRKDETGSEASLTAQARVADGIETILLVKDELTVCRLARTLLQSQGYRVYAAGSRAEALSVWRAGRTEIDLRLTDIKTCVRIQASRQATT